MLLLVVAALVADYATPAEPWAVLPPLACIVMLTAMRRWAAAAATVLLSSWVAVPIAAYATCALDAAAGKQRVYAVGWTGVPVVDPTGSNAAARARSAPASSTCPPTRTDWSRASSSAWRGCGFRTIVNAGIGAS